MTEACFSLSDCPNLFSSIKNGHLGPISLPTNISTKSSRPTSSRSSESGSSTTTSCLRSAQHSSLSTQPYPKQTPQISLASVWCISTQVATGMLNSLNDIELTRQNLSTSYSGSTKSLSPTELGLKQSHSKKLSSTSWLKRCEGVTKLFRSKISNTLAKIRSRRAFYRSCLDLSLVAFILIAVLRTWSSNSFSSLEGHTMTSLTPSTQSITSPSHQMTEKSKWQNPTVQVIQSTKNGIDKTY